ncbi:MAG: ATP-binding protein [Candidatus Cloacimonetes bacterium]|jgi:signal transduction histidine kinase|nr:ATP-binding protein [Candidatus Cloacimonadota bacterium]MDD2505847.1 ATP-binding protein [Candidatus Cloacimonadota bacterium]MDD4559476.1 ATP-binding protein [Candidatus Cloacimonadota bacterium]
MKLRTIIVFLLSFLLGSCWFTQSFLTHELKLQRTNRYENPAINTIVADLKGDGRELQISAFYENNLGRIEINNQEGKTISQINTANYRPGALKVLENPKDKSTWLFYSMNNGSTLSLRAAKYTWQVPLLRENKGFVPYYREDELMDLDSYTWTAFFVPQIIDDIDGDDRLEIVCTAYDGYSSNPRGLIAYDWESGAQKWFYRSPAVFSGFFYDDFDLDGSKEFLLSNISFNNNTMSIDGLNDFSGNLVILNTKGELTHLHRIFDGLGALTVNVADVDQDGKLDIFAVASTRGNNTDADCIIRFSYDDGRLIRKKELSLPKSLMMFDHNDFLQRMDSSSEYRLILSDALRGIICFDEDLNECHSRTVRNVKRICTITDIDHNGKKEIIALNNEDELQVFNHDLLEIARTPLSLEDQNLMGIRVINRAEGMQTSIAVIMDKSIHFYYLQHISFFLLVYRLLKAHALWLMLILLAIVIYMGIYISKRKQDAISTYNLLDEGVFLVNKKGCILFANKVAISMAPQNESRSYCKHLRTISPDLDEALAKMRRSMSSQEHLEIILNGKPLKVSLQRSHSYSGRYFIFMYRKLADIESDTLQWAETARRLSHHVRRHITNVILALDPLEKDCSQEDAEYLDIIKSEIEKVRVFTHAFQRFTEMHNYDLKVQDLIPSVEHALSNTKIRDNIKIIRNYNLKSIHAKIEPIRFEEAIVNIINNATEAMPEGGTLHISIREFPLHQSPGGNLSVLVEIEDSGKGIPQKYMEDIWKPFFTTNQSGTGIGIPETRKIVDSMGGLIDIQSEEGLGTTVSIWLKGSQDE